MQIDPSQSVTINSSISGIGNLTKTGTGVLVLPNSDFFTQGTTVSAGEIIAGSKLSLGSSTLSLKGGTVSLQAGPTAEVPIVFGSQTTITNETESGFTVTATTPAASGFTVGQSVTVAGSPVAGYNGTFAVTAVTTAAPFTFTYTSGVDGLAPPRGGTAVGVSSRL